MSDIFRELNTYRPYTGTVTRDDEAVDLSTADHVAITVRRVSDKAVLVDHEEMEITDAANGLVQYEFTAEELGAESAGNCELQIEIWWDTEKSESVEAADGIEIRDHFGTHA